jgi:hypothetical protein
MQSEIEATGRAWRLVEAARLFAGGVEREELGSGRSVANSTLKEAARVSREVLEAMAAGEAHGCSRMLAYAHICSRMLAYADVC